MDCAQRVMGPWSEFTFLLGIVIVRDSEPYAKNSI